MDGNVLVASQEFTRGETSSLPNIAGEYESLIIPSHPLRIKPAGNLYTATENIKLAAGSFARLPDELIIQVLESLDAASLRRLGCLCKALYAFSRLEELWKTLCLEYEHPLSGLFLGISLPQLLSEISLLGCLLLLPSSGLLFQRKRSTRLACELEYILQIMYILQNLKDVLEYLLLAKHLHIMKILFVVHHQSQGTSVC